MNETIFNKMGGERVCSLCGYVEREVYRLFCPHCMQRDHLSTLITKENPHDPLTYPLESSDFGTPMEGLPLS